MTTSANRWRMLHLGRGDAFLADAYEGLHSLREQAGLSDASKKDIGFTIQYIVSASEFHGFLMFSKPHFDQSRQLIRDALDQALKKLDIMAAVTGILDEQYSGDLHQIQ